MQFKLINIHTQTQKKKNNTNTPLKRTTNITESYFYHQKQNKMKQKTQIANE